MSALPLLIEFSDKGIRVRVEGTDLALSAPKGALTPNLISRIRNEKPALLFSLDRLQEKAGDDWAEVSSDPAKLRAFFDILEIEDMRLQGIVPDHYTATTECKYCGPVPIWEGCPPQTQSCPWCFNRIKELKIPEVNNNE